MAGVDVAVVLSNIAGLDFRKHHNPNCWEESLKDFYISASSKLEGPTSFNSPTPLACIHPNNRVVIQPLLLVVIFSDSNLLNGNAPLYTKIYIYKSILVLISIAIIIFLQNIE